MESDSSESLGHLLRRLAAARTREDEALSLAAFLAERGIATERERIGRYIVRKLLGRGGFGAVILADDPLLHRRVALKVAHRVADSHEAREQFAAEARRLAKFSHPHVVQVFDHGDSQFGPWIAMEYVEGETLRAWQADQRSWREVLDAYVQAGRGLEAAHAVDLVHCDVKPSNLLRRADGRVLVSDFGLSLVAPVSSSADGPSQVSASVDEGSATQGGVGGTPGYQAPEVIATRRADARSDQYSLCVSMFEALGGKRVAGDPARAVRRDARIPGVPRWLTRALYRGLEPDPQRRYPDMGALLHALTRPRRGVGLASVIAVPFVATVLGASGGSEPSECTAAGEIASLWSPVQREQVASRFEHAGERRRVLAAIDAYTAAWNDDYAAVCGDDSIDTSDASTAVDCLARHHHRLESVVAALRDPDARSHADDLLARLGELPSCGAADRSSAASERQRDLVAAAYAAIDRTGVELATARFPAALGSANEALVLATESGDTDALAEARFLRGRILDELGSDEDARAELSAAALLADSARNARLAASAWHALARLAAVDLVDATLARDAAERGRVAVTRAGSTPALEAENLVAFSEVSLVRGDEAETEALLSSALALRHADRWVDPEVAEIEALLANSVARQGRLDEADALYLGALEVQEQLRGAEHPEVARLEFNLGVDARERGRYDDARRHLSRALAIQERAFGKDSIRVAPTLVLLGELSLRAREFDAAAELAARAHEIQTRSLPKFHPDRGSGAALLAGTHFERGDLQAALDASLVHIGELPTGAPEEAEAANMIGWLLCKLDRCAEARPYYLRVSALARDPVTAAFGQAGIACAELASDPGRAEPLLRAALERAHEVGVPPLVAEMEEHLARALAQLGRSPTQIAELERSARKRRREIEAEGRTLLDSGDATLRAGATGGTDDPQTGGPDD